MSGIDVARRYAAAWNARDAARLAGTFRPGGTYEDPSTGGPLEPGPLQHYAGALWTAFPDLTFEEVDYRETAPGEIVFRWIMRGTNRGSLRGLPPTGATIALPGVDLIVAHEDGVERVQGYFDRATLDGADGRAGHRPALRRRPGALRHEHVRQVPQSGGPRRPLTHDDRRADRRRGPADPRRQPPDHAAALRHAGAS